MQTDRQYARRDLHKEQPITNLYVVIVLLRKLPDQNQRRKLFEQRMPFQFGVLARTHTPLIYVPLKKNRWKESRSGRALPMISLPLEKSGTFLFKPVGERAVLDGKGIRASSAII